MRQVHRIFVLIAGKAVNQHAVQRETLERVVAIGGYRELNLINRRGTISGSDGDTGLSVQAAFRHAHRLPLIAFDRHNLRQRRRTDGQRIGVRQHIGVEALQRHTAYRDAVQRRAVGFLGRKDNLIHRLVAVSGSYRHSVSTVHYAFAKRRRNNRLELVAGRPTDSRQLGCTQRQIEVIGGTSGFELAEEVHTVLDHPQVLQIAVGRSFKFQI